MSFVDTILADTQTNRFLNDFRSFHPLISNCASRFFTRLTGSTDDLPLGAEVWGDTRIITLFECPGTRYRNIFTGEIVSSLSEEEATVLNLAEVLHNFPVALLERI